MANSIRTDSQAFFLFLPILLLLSDKYCFSAIYVAIIEVLNPMNEPIPVSPEIPFRPAAHLTASPARWAVGCLALIFIFSTLCIVGAAGVYVYYASGLAAADQLGSAPLSQSTKIYDRNGGLLYEVLDPQSGKRTVVKPDQIPLVLKQATVATEDQSFYSNLGIDPVGVARAIYYLVRYGRVISGGSTIAQQLVKNTLLTPEVTVQRKIREAVLAMEVTRRYSKDQILTMYLNAIYYGNLSYGIQAAAQTYFNKDVSKLDLAEASLLVGLPQAPASYDPCDNPDAALNRQKTVLGLMVSANYVTSAQAASAQNEMQDYLNSPAFDHRCTPQTSLQDPHFVNYVRAQLEKQFGPEVAYKGGLQVTTTIDPRVQAIAQEEAQNQIKTLGDRNVTNASVVILNPHTGEILAMVGSVDFNNKQISGQVNVADALRQPGSSIKPINYVTAFSNGWTPATPLYDLKTNFPDGNGRPPYVPVDYDHRERGLVSARLALANSLNIPAVKTLYSTSTKDANNFPQPLAMIQTARRLGITTLTDSLGNPLQTYGLALTLGGGDVKLIELTGAYAVFANQGTRVPPTPFVKIVDGTGQIIYDVSTASKQHSQCALFDPNAPDETPDANNVCAKSAPYAYLITNILSDNEARKLAFGANNPLQVSRPAAVKTGTTDDFRDNWTIGYTPDLVVGVWVGNANNSPMQNVSGVTGAAPIWHNILERVTAGTPARDLPAPPGIVRTMICTDSGLLATNLCPKNHQHEEVFVEGHAPSAQDNVWRQLRCGHGQQLYQVPPHDVDNLIPYDQIRAWAGSHGWKVPPRNKACAGNDAVTTDNQSQPNPVYQQGSPTKGKGKGKKNK